MELARLLILTSAVVTLLLLVKKNSLDLGLLMGGSIGGGFFLRKFILDWTELFIALFSQLYLTHTMLQTKTFKLPHFTCAIFTDAL